MSALGWLFVVVAVAAVVGVILFCAGAASNDEYPSDFSDELDEYYTGEMR